mgnify:CR=1 FL=1|tara:strand:- start:2340 stop:3032 length:693 start_codon:yes stop_codon:yes gene_type:complete
MRTKNQILKIKKTHSSPFVIKDILIDPKEYLNYYFDNQHKHVKKNTGPIVLKIEKNNKLLQYLTQNLQNKIGSFTVRYAHIFDVTIPHIIHVDDTYEYLDCYKAFTIPLKLYGNSDDVKLVIFDQYYYHGPAKFYNGDNISTRKVYYNKSVNNYKYVSFKSKQSICENIYKKHLTHCKKSWLNNLSIDTLLDWKIGNILCFDSLQLHCSSNFLLQNITRKIALSIFTVKE